PAVLVLDHELRWGGAEGVLAVLREDRFPRSVAVVLAAPKTDPKEIAEEHEPPAVRFLVKPFGLKALLEIVQAAIAKERQEESVTNRVPETACLSENFLG